MRSYRARRGRPAASEMVGAVLAIGMTLIAGAAAWGFARGQAGASESALQSNAVNTNNFLSEHFGVVDMYFSTSTATGGACAGGLSCSAVFWVYNTGSVTYSTFSIRLYGSGGNINVLFNYTQSGATRTGYVYDLRSNLANLCKTAATNYVAPSLTSTNANVKTTNAQVFTLTIPGTQGSCPSFGNTFQSTHTYTVVVTGIYGNVVTYSQTM